jgi:hypothetical protein
MTTSTNHKKSSSLPGKLNMRRYSPLKMPHLDPIDPTEVLRPSFEDPITLPHALTSWATQRDGLGTAPDLFISTMPLAENIDVKEVTAARKVRVLDKSPIEENIRNSERPELGVVVLEKDSLMQDPGSSTPSDDQTATSSPAAKPQALGLPQGTSATTRKQRRRLRNLWKSVF